jgi:peptidyl-prolyl cis-trans isomerase D
MLRVLRQGQRWLVSLVIIGVGGVFVFFMGWGAPSGQQGPGTIVRVGSYNYGINEFGRERRTRSQQYEEALGDSFDATKMSSTLDHLAVETLIQRTVLAMSALELGLTVSKEEIEKDLLRSNAFRGEDGRFDPDAFNSWAEYEYGNQRIFMREQRTALLASKMLRLIGGLAYVSMGEARDAMQRRMEEVQIAFVKIDASEQPVDLAIKDDAIETFLSEREAEAQAFYEENTSRYNVTEQVRARHILLRAESTLTEEQRAAVRVRADELLARIKEGEDFEALARDASEDPGSKDKSGDLGFFGRGQMVKGFEDVAFALEPGSMSDVVETSFGFHIIRTEAYRAADHQSYESVRSEIAREIIGKEASMSVARNVASALSEAVKGGAKLEDAARARGLTLERTGFINRRADGYIPGLGAAQDMMAKAFTLVAGQSSDEIFEVGDTLALFQVLARQQPDASGFEAKVALEQQAMLKTKREAQLQEWIATRRSDLARRGEIEIQLDNG